jgi:DNA methylase
MMLPARYAIACTDQLGLILRAEIVWHKTNGLPESVTDRVRRSHESVFHFTKRARYYSALDGIRLPHTGHHGHDARAARSSDTGANHRALAHDETLYNPLGKLPGSVWPIPSQRLDAPPSLGVEHYAAFPTALVRPIIAGWSPAAVCSSCDQGRRPVVVKTLDVAGMSRRTRPKYIDGAEPAGNTRGMNAEIAPHGTTVATITGYTCRCGDTTAPARPGVVLDPFGGTGTTVMVADVLGRHGIGVDRSADYCRLAAWRVADPQQRARAAGVPWQPPRHPAGDGQATLFDVA